MIHRWSASERNNEKIETEKKAIAKRRKTRNTGKSRSVSSKSSHSPRDLAHGQRGFCARKALWRSIVQIALAVVVREYESECFVCGTLPQQIEISWSFRCPKREAGKNCCAAQRIDQDLNRSPTLRQWFVQQKAAFCWTNQLYEYSSPYFQQSESIPCSSFCNVPIEWLATSQRPKLHFLYLEQFRYIFLRLPFGMWGMSPKKFLVLLTQFRSTSCTHLSSFMLNLWPSQLHRWSVHLPSWALKDNQRHAWKRTDSLSGLCYYRRVDFFLRGNFADKTEIRVRISVLWCAHRASRWYYRIAYSFEY